MTWLWECQSPFSPGPAPRGAFRGCSPPNDCLCPPKRKLCPTKRGLCPEEINKLGATGVQIEAQIGAFHRYFRVLWPDIGFHDIFGMKTFFFFGDDLFSAGKKV